jgi:hypothetical protein
MQGPELTFNEERLMAPIAIVFGVLLVILSGVLYGIADNFSPTIFIPAGFGAVLIVLGLLALKDAYRKHAMHGAAVVGLIGFAFPLGRLIYAMTGENFVFRKSTGGTVAMSVLCLIFLILCVKSFIEARAARKAKEGQTPVQ